MFIILDLYHRRSLRDGAKPTSNRNPNRNPSPAKVAEHMCAAHVFCCPQAGLGLRLGLQFELGLVPPPTFSTNYFLSVAPAADKEN